MIHFSFSNGLDVEIFQWQNFNNVIKTAKGISLTNGSTIALPQWLKNFLFFYGPLLCSHNSVRLGRRDEALLFGRMKKSHTMGRKICLKVKIDENEGFSITRNHHDCQGLQIQSFDRKS